MKAIWILQSLMIVGLAILCWHQQERLQVVVDTERPREIKQMPVASPPSNLTKEAPGEESIASPRRDLDATAEMIGEAAADFLHKVEDPDVQQLTRNRQVATAAWRYAELFRELKLSPEKVESMKVLLTEKQMVSTDVMMSVAKLGLKFNDGKELKRMIAKAEGEIDGRIKEEIGEDSYRKYTEFQSSQPQRSTLGQLEQRLSYTDTPLTPEQSQELLKIMTVPNPDRSATSSSITPGRGSLITPELLARSKDVLAPAQLVALEELRKQQQISINLAKKMRTISANRSTK